jgi:hypothetical protein
VKREALSGVMTGAFVGRVKGPSCQLDEAGLTADRRAMLRSGAERGSGLLVRMRLPVSFITSGYVTLRFRVSVSVESPLVRGTSRSKRRSASVFDEELSAHTTSMAIAPADRYGAPGPPARPSPWKSSSP